MASSDAAASAELGRNLLHPPPRAAARLTCAGPAATHSDSHDRVDQLGVCEATRAAACLYSAATAWLSQKIGSRGGVLYDLV